MGVGLWVVDLLHLVLLLIGFVYLVAFECFVNWC